jgi:hypothetical protein
MQKKPCLSEDPSTKLNILNPTPSQRNKALDRAYVLPIHSQQNTVPVSVPTTKKPIKF